MSRRAAEVALGAVLVHGDVEAADSGFGILLTVGLEGVDEGVGGVVGLFEVVGLDLSRLLECLAGLAVWSHSSAPFLGSQSILMGGTILTELLHLEGVRGLDVQIRRILVLLLAAAEEAEAAAGARQRLVCLCSSPLTLCPYFNSPTGGSSSLWRRLPGGTHASNAPSAAEPAGPEP